MEKNFKELYELDDVVDYLKGGNFIKNSNYFRVIGLTPSKVEKRLEFAKPDSIMLKGESFNKRRETIKDMALGCDFYYEVDIVPETAGMRRDLALSRTLVTENNGLVDIEEKRYFVLYPLNNLTKEEQKRIKSLKIKLQSKVWVLEDENGVRLSFDEPNESASLLARQGYLITAANVKKIEESGLADLLLSDDNFECLMQDKNGLRKTSYSEAMSATVLYHPNDKVAKKSSTVSSERIVSFYEYDPIIERPTFGESYELMMVGLDANGAPIWRKYPKIIQNQNSIEYRNRAIKKGVRTVVMIDQDNNENVLDMLASAGKLDQVKEFSVFEEMGDDFLIERPMLDKNLRDEISNTQVKL